MTDTNGDRPVSARTREADQGRAACVLVFVKKWKDLIIAVILLPTAIATLALGLEVRGYSKARADDAKVVRRITQQRAEDAKATAAAARAACLRSRQYGPALADFFEREHVFPPSALDTYRATIPKTCPK